MFVSQKPRKNESKMFRLSFNSIQLKKCFISVTFIMKIVLSKKQSHLFFFKLITQVTHIIYKFFFAPSRLSSFRGCFPWVVGWLVGVLNSVSSIGAVPVSFMLLESSAGSACNRWKVWWNRTTSVPKSVLRYDVDKVKKNAQAFNIDIL